MKQFLFFMLVLTNSWLYAQTLTNYTVDDGLSSNSVNCLTIGIDDKVWFGTQEGIASFDGTTWTTFNQSSNPAMVSDNILAITIDSDNVVWMGTDFGLNAFDGSNWYTYTEADGLLDNRVKAIEEGPNGKIWVANNDGISIFDGSNWESFGMSDGLPFGGITCIAFDATNKAYLGTPFGGVAIVEGNSITLLGESEGLLSNKVTTIAIDADDNKWIGTADGISVFDANNDFVVHHEHIFELPPPDLLNPIEDIEIASDGRVWVGVYVDYLVTEGGISTYDGSEWSDYDVSDGLVGPVVRQIGLNSKDELWVATSTGVSHFSYLPASTYSLELDAAIMLYPNPVDSYLNIEVPSDLIDKSYQIVNGLGQLISAKRIETEREEVDIQQFDSGIYFLKIEGGYGRTFLVH